MFYLILLFVLLVHYFIKMEDVAAGMVKPCIADIKIGRQTWDPFSSTEKKLNENVSYWQFIKLITYKA